MADHTSFSGAIPAAYDRYLGPLLFEPHAKDLAGRIKNKKNLSVLELACGTGRLTQYLKKELSDSRIAATDLNQDMIELAKVKVKGDNIVWKQADMQEIPFEDSSFDLVVCQFGIMFVPDKVKTYKEVYRVLKPGGIFLFNTWDSLENNRLAYITDEVINSFFENDPITFYQIPYSYFKEDKISDELLNGGFKDILFTHIHNEGKSQSVFDTAKGLIEGNPTLISNNERNPDLVERVKNKLSKALSEKFGENPMKCSMNVIVVETVK